VEYGYAARIGGTRIAYNVFVGKPEEEVISEI
jgi:hypothetical protein